MISLDKQIELIADLSLNYQYELEEQDDNWKRFFRLNDLAVPFCTLYYLRLVNYSITEVRRNEMEAMVRKCFYDLCDVLNIPRDSKHLSIPDMFRRSPNPDIPQFDAETLALIARLPGV